MNLPNQFDAKFLVSKFYQTVYASRTCWQICFFRAWRLLSKTFIPKELVNSYFILIEAAVTSDLDKNTMTFFCKMNRWWIILLLRIIRDQTIFRLYVTKLLRWMRTIIIRNQSIKLRLSCPLKQPFNFDFCHIQR